MEQKEYRALAKTELRAAGKKIVGYAAKFGPLSEDLGGFRERILPGAFAHSLRYGADVRALVDHDPSKIIGRNSAGTLALLEDHVGLHIEVDPPDTTTGRDVVESIRRGDLTQMSFAFRRVRDRWTEAGGIRIRELLDLELLDISVVTFPAYPDTEVAVRSLGSPAIELRWYRGDVEAPRLDADTWDAERERARCRIKLAQRL